MAKTRRKHNECLNCHKSFPQDNNFCPNCGQENHDRKVKLKFLLHDFLVDYFTFDSKMIRSITPLLFKPGKLTREFNAGHRIKFIPPLRLYIFISIIYFALLHVVMNSDADIHEPQQDSTTFTIGEVDTTKVKPGNGPLFTFDSLDSQFFSEPEQRALIDSLGEDGYLDYMGVEGALNRFVVTKLIHIANDPDSLIEDFQKNTAYMFFFFIPFFALLLKLFFRKSGKFYVEHVVFALHFHSFAFFFASILYGFSILWFDVYNPLVYFLVSFVYLLLAMKHVYQNNWFWTTFKWLWLMVLYAVFLILFLGITIFISFLIF